MKIRSPFVREPKQKPQRERTRAARFDGATGGGFGNLLRSTGGQPWEVFGYSGLELYRGALSIPAFWRGAMLEADLLAQVPWDAFTEHGRDQETLISPRPSLLEQPSPPMTRMTTFKSMMLDYVVHGNAIAIIAARDSKGTPTSLWPVPARWAWNRRITEKSQATTFLPIGSVEYAIGGETYDSNDILHFMGPCSPGALRGFGALEAHFEGALDTAHQLQKDAKKASRHGVPPGYLRYTGPEPIDPADLAEARDDWMAQRDAGGIAALNANVEFVPVSWNPDEAQLIEARQMSDNQIANILGLPASFVNSSNAGAGSLTYATVDSEALGLLKWTMGGIFEQWAQTLSLLFPHGTCVRADLDHFLRGDTQARYTAYALGIDAGWLLRSEVRKMEHLPVVAGIDAEPLPRKAELADEKGDPVAAAVAQVPPPGTPAAVKAQADRIPALAAAQGARASQLQATPHGRQLWDWLTSAKGTATYIGSPNPWTTLVAFLVSKGVPAGQADGEATNIMQATPAGRAAFAAHHQKGA